MERYDVVIVGGGLAGLQCSRLLSAQNLRVLLLDRKANLSELVHTTGIFVRRTLEDFEIPERFLGPSVRQVNLVSPAGRETMFRSPHSEFRIGQMAGLYEFWLNQSVQQGVDWRPSSTLTDAAPMSTGCRVSFEEAGATVEVQTRFLIGADGANSRTASVLGLSENREWIVGVESIFANTTESTEGGRPRQLKRPPTLHCFLDPRLAPGYLAWIADDGQESHVGVGGYANRFHPNQALDEFIATSAKHIADFSAAEPLERRGGRIPVGGILPQIVNERGLLVGDAAGAVSPLTAGGLDPCMRLSALAAKVTVDFLQSGEMSALAPYRGNRFRRRFRKRRIFRRAIAAIRSRPLAEAACAALRLPVLRNLASRIFFAPASFPIERRELDSILPTPNSASRRHLA